MKAPTYWRRQDQQSNALVPQILLITYQFVLRILFQSWKRPQRCRLANHASTHRPLLVGLTTAGILLHDLAGLHAQVCSETPLVLRSEASGTVGHSTFIYTPGYELGSYNSNMTCNWLLTASNSGRRILITVHDSQLDDAIFSQCDDYCAIYDGSSEQSMEIVRWCGKHHPNNVISSTDTLLVKFHSDDAFQGRGINMSFIEFDVPGCPPNWMSNSAGFCYLLRTPANGQTWTESQMDCLLQRSNLLTFSSTDEYAPFRTLYNDVQMQLWIGYADFQQGGHFVAVDQSEKSWPEDLPLTRPEADSNCVFINWSRTNDHIFVTDDCRNRHGYMCKQRQDGGTTPNQPQIELMRKGLSKSSVDFTILLFIVILLVLLFILLYLCYRKCCNKHAQSRVGSSDMNQRLVIGVDSQRGNPAVILPRTGAADPPNKPTSSTNDNDNARVTRQPRDASNPRPLKESDSTTIWPPSVVDEPWARVNKHDEQTSNSSSSSGTEHSMGGRRRLGERQSNVINVHAVQASKLDDMTNVTRDAQLAKIRRNELFERPCVSVLQHASAISLDEFWRHKKQ